MKYNFYIIIPYFRVYIMLFYIYIIILSVQKVPERLKLGNVNLTNKCILVVKKKYIFAYEINSLLITQMGVLRG